ncbi:MAG: WD40/YVTN/BNR-like repeat-containing protein [Candidatus Acidiferrales bacterium]
MQTRIALATILLLSIPAATIAPPQAPPKSDPWKAIDVATTASFRGLSAPTGEIMWASGTGGTVIRTTDNGATWSVRTVAGAEKLDFRGIQAFDAFTAVIMGSGNAEDGQARIYRTTDGGENWKIVYEQKTRGIFFDAIAFWDAQHGIVVSDPVEGRFALFSTEDGGATWSQIPPANVPAALANEGAFAASNSCLTVEGAGNVWFVTGGAAVARVFRSSDRGKSWQVAETPLRPPNASSGLFSIAFRDANNGIAVGGDYAHPSDSPGPVIFLSSDGGATWRDGGPTNPPGLFLSSVIYKPAAANTKSRTAEAVAAGTGGIISTQPGGKWIRDSERNVNAVAFPTHNTGWAVGPKGTVLRRNK